MKRVGRQRLIERDQLMFDCVAGNHEVVERIRRAVTELGVTPGKRQRRRVRSEQHDEREPQRHTCGARTGHRGLLVDWSRAISVAEKSTMAPGEGQRTVSTT